MTDIDYADNQALLAKFTSPSRIPSAESKQAAGSIGLYVNANKREYMRFKQKEDISTQSDKPQQLVNLFTYLSSNISSTENDINIWLAVMWTAIAV